MDTEVKLGSDVPVAKTITLALVGGRLPHVNKPSKSITRRCATHPLRTFTSRPFRAFTPINVPTLAIGKENRPPRGMVPAAKPKKNATSTTPGRRQRTDNQYFDVGKVGRKTGITLKDTGIRDEHGLEPVSGIFSSPVQDGDETLTSEGMDVEDSTYTDSRRMESHILMTFSTGSAPDVTQTLASRKTPRFPPPRQSTPRHTNIGSPKRMSSVKPTSRAGLRDDEENSRAHTQPPANRRLDFGATNRNRKSISVIDAQSPFKPKKMLRRSNGPVRPDPYDIPVDDDEEDPRTFLEHTIGAMEDTGEEDEDIEQSIEMNDDPVMLDDGDSQPMEFGQTETDHEEPQEEISVPSDTPLRRKRGRPRKSDQSLTSSQMVHAEPVASSSKKRTRASLDNNETPDESSVSIATGAMGPPPKKSRSSNVHAVAEQSPVADQDDYMVEDDYGVSQHDSEIAAQLDSQLGIAETQSEPKRRGRPKGKGKAAASKATTSTAKRGSPVKVNESPSKRYRGGSVGPVSNVNLRATTPFEDANQTTSRFGRNLIQPLKYWENESRIYRAGNIEGIIRAEPVEKPVFKNSKRRRKGRKARSGLQDIEEESDAESIMPDEWEDEIGVMSGSVAVYDKETKTGDTDDMKQEGG